MPRGSVFLPKMFKFRMVNRYSRNILLNFIVFFGGLVSIMPSFAQDSLMREGFSTEKEALDSLISWVTHPKYERNYGFLNDSQFVLQLRKIDTVTPAVMVRAQRIQYKYQFLKQIHKFEKYCKQNSIRFVVNEKSKTGPAKFKEPPLEYKNSGPFKVRRYEYELLSKKDTFIFSFELWWVNDHGYWINELRIYSKD